MPMTDDIRRWSDELARDPASLAFLPLGEALRREGQLDVARRVAVRGLERHPHHPDAHDLLARVYVDAGEFQSAFDEWDTALELSPDHTGSLKGLAFVCFQQGRLDEAEAYLRRAALGDAPDAGISTAFDTLRRTSPTPPAGQPAVGAASTPDPDDPAFAFASVLDGDGQTALLLDASGFVLAGAYFSREGSDLGPEVGAQLSGVSDEARRAMRHLELGAWTSIVFETETAAVALTPAAGDGLLVLAASRATPLGLLRRQLARCSVCAREWLALRGWTPGPAAATEGPA
jgi:tetratricopeptide (TPR) repeat protein